MCAEKTPVQLGRFGTWLKGRGLFIRTFAALILIGALSLSVYVCWIMMRMSYDIIVAASGADKQDKAKGAIRSSDGNANSKHSLLEPDPKASLNPAWIDRYSSNNRRRGYEGGALSAAGYPIAVVINPTVVCSGPLRLQLAKDLQIAQRMHDVEKMEDCAILSAGMRAEWIDPNPFDNGTVTLRLHPPGALPFTVYGPDPNGGNNPFFAWFGTISRSPQPTR